MSNATVLVVDDSVTMRTMLKDLLTDAGFSVDVSEDGQDALEKTSHTHFDFIFTDQNMPKLDGLGFIKSLRTMPEYQETPVVMLTTEASQEMKMKGKAVGANGWMVKPFDPSKVVMVCNKLLN